MILDIFLTAASRARWCRGRVACSLAFLTLVTLPFLCGAAVPEALAKELPATQHGNGRAPGSPITERLFENSVEIDQAADVITKAIGASVHGGVTAEQVIDALNARAAESGSPGGQSFPSRMVATVYSCGPAYDNIKRLVIARYCRGGHGGYTEVLITSFLHWSSFEKINDRESISRYLDRTNAFTIGQIGGRLEALGYRNLGVVQGQIIFMGLPTPLVHTGFMGGSGAPLIVVGHRPEVPPPGATRVLPPSVIELRLYFRR